MPTQDKNLEVVALFIADPARRALQASFVMNAADAFFNQEQTRFKTFVGNTMTYGCLKAAEDLALVEIASVIANEKDPEEIKKTGPGDRHPLQIQVAGKANLILHRHMICHPEVVCWRTPTKQAFAKTGHKWNAVRAGLVWSVLKQINEALRVQGSEVHLDDVPVIPEMGAMLRAILGSAGMPLGEHHSDALLYRYFEIQKQNFTGILEQFPDGIITEAANPRP